jgi:rhamnose transport system ATP-binding protein
MTAPVLNLSGVRKSFGGVHALTGGALALYPGQVTALIGENGAGKSTLVKILSGVLQPDAGVIKIDGRPTRIATPTAALRLGVCTVHQESVIFDELTVAENIFAAERPQRFGLIDWSGMKRKARALLQSLDVSVPPDELARNLSVGERHLVQIARALAHEARVLIFDEPTAALSRREAEDLFAVIRKLRDGGRAMLFISHKFEEVFSLCDRYAVFRDGAAVGEGLVADATPDQLIALMVGRELSAIYPPREAEIGKELLRIQGLSRRDTFSDVSFSVRAGEIVGVYGLVGAGRSEIMRAVFGADAFDSGEVILDGRPRRFHAPAAAIRGGLAYVPEDRQREGAALSLSVADNISIASLPEVSRCGFVDRALERQRVMAFTEQLKIKAENLDAPVESLSGGNQQKVVLAKWLATAPRVLIMDEPTKGVDVGAKAAVHASLRKLSTQGIGIVMVSSDMPEILGMSDRIVVVRRGRVRAVLDANDADETSVMKLAADA